LKRLISDMPISAMGGDGQYETRAGWIAPIAVDPRDAAEARRYAVACAEELERRAEDAVVRRWLASLALAVAGGMNADDAKAKLQVLTLIFAKRYPASMWTDDRLADVARACKWFPSASELSDILDKHVERMEAVRVRAETVANTKPNGGEAPAPDHDREARDALARVRDRCKPRGPWGEGLSSWADMPVETIKAKWARHGGAA
jgi:hypothetical protein